VYLIGPAAASFFLCLLAMFALRPLAIAVNLIDRPGGRKLHVGEVPVVGGLGMLLGMVLGMGLVPLPDSTIGTLLAACAILVTVGLIDDRFGLSPWTRLPVQIAATLVLILGTRAVVVTLGAPFGEEIRLEGAFAFVFTVLIVVAAINAFNMLDGMDGLAGALAMVALVSLAIVAHDGGVVAALSASMVIIGAVAAFLISNLPINLNRDVRCFMGDSGSTLLGFSVAWLCIVVSQGPAPAVMPVTTFWIVALPLYELSWTVIRRTIRGISPFKPDNGHLHHLVLQAGFGVRGAFVLFAVLAILLASFGIAVDRLGMSDSSSFALFVVAGVLIVRLLYRVEILWKLIPRSLRGARPAREPLHKS
jgi:UDP-GlcNAc:undecaprenyl-phosphate GlcNAc-1-phosphate transferase